ncbi:GntR family transcriptional regulator [Novosphingobium sp. Rr 2-17]|uniref:Rrf2 family transcriptional regulator n=1 Tax=Novosphingobium sp. Rr 2-17 TaxID=555793 RepID=UPI000269985C|nr:Rrf2 family transcriptional regulator [Novosphingobium sp. Rr 2-17]EIZ79804.1 GntR family transcriptional regulator [Novosphingobium sp. Rr 2-17]
MQSINADNVYLLETGMIAGRHAHEVKRAHRLADQLQRDLLGGALTENFSLGTILEIRERYGLGLWACREAIGILELRGVAQLRAGRHGGLVPVTPTLEDLAKLALLHLYMKRASTRELIEARRLVHLAVLRQLIERGGRISEFCEWRAQRFTQASGARSSSAGNFSFSHWLAARTGNGAFGFFVGFVEAVCEKYADYCGEPKPAPDASLHRKEEAVWRAICRKESQTARLALLDYLTARMPMAADKPIRVRRLLDDHNLKGSVKVARRIAMRLVEEVVEDQSNAMTDLGSEIDIGMRHDANSAIVRQAMRLLEDLGLVRPRRGRNGGIALRKPDLMSIIGMIPHVLMGERLSLSQCFHARSVLTIEICMAAAAARGAGGATGEPHLPVSGRAQDLIGLDRALLDLLGNSMLTTCAQGFMMYAWRIEPPGDADDVPPAIVSRLFAMTRKIADQILAADVEGAEAAAVEKDQLLALRFTSPEASRSKARHPLNVLSHCVRDLPDCTLPV